MAERDKNRQTMRLSSIPPGILGTECETVLCNPVFLNDVRMTGPSRSLTSINVADLAYVSLIIRAICCQLNLSLVVDTRILNSHRDYTKVFPVQVHLKDDLVQHTKPLPFHLCRFTLEDIPYSRYALYLHRLQCGQTLSFLPGLCIQRALFIAWRVSPAKFLLAAPHDLWTPSPYEETLQCALCRLHPVVGLPDLGEAIHQVDVEVD